MDLLELSKPVDKVLWSHQGNTSRMTASVMGISQHLDRLLNNSWFVAEIAAVWIHRFGRIALQWHQEVSLLWDMAADLWSSRPNSQVLTWSWTISTLSDANRLLNMFIFCCHLTQAFEDLKFKEVIHVIWIATLHFAQSSAVQCQIAAFNRLLYCSLFLNGDFQCHQLGLFQVVLISDNCLQ